MANVCCFEMRITGRTDAVAEFLKVINYKRESENRFFFRTLLTDVMEDMTEDRNRVVSIVGECAWSVHSCMREGYGSYYGDSDKDYGTTLKKESEKLGITIEVYSDEPGMCFQEHYLYIDGDCVADECVHCETIFLNGQTLGDYNNENGTNYSEDDLSDDGESIVIGGFKEWGFSCAA